MPTIPRFNAHHPLPSQLRGTVTPLPPTVVVGAPSAPAALSAPLGSRMPSAPGPRNRIAAQSTPLPAVDVPADVAVVSMDYAAAARHMAILLRDGRLALCRCGCGCDYDDERQQRLSCITGSVHVGVCRATYTQLQQPALTNQVGTCETMKHASVDHVAQPSQTSPYFPGWRTRASTQ